MATDDIPRWPHRPPGRPGIRVLGRHPLRASLIGLGLAAYSWIAAGTVPFTRNALLIVLLPGAVAAVIAYGRPPRRIPAPQSMDVAGFSYWAIAVTALFEWEASGFRDSSPWWHPSLTELINPTLDAHPVKAVAILVWLLSGWALVRR
ncbi:MAG TPA: hypothetical protein VMI33_15045 [Streptosporangiaceae bacterium]|nr:hypothetical protein [Streptosporangiaceae bacterium]